MARPRRPRGSRNTGEAAAGMSPGGSAAPLLLRQLPCKHDGVPAERRRAVIEGVRPEIDRGEHSIKRIVGDVVTVEFDAFADGHDELAADVLYRRECDEAWRRAPATLVENDRWRA